MTFKERVAHNMKYYRKLRGLTLKEVAAKCDMTEANLQKYESGNMKSLDVDTTYKIASALNVKPEDLTGWKSNEDGGRLAAHGLITKRDGDALHDFLDLSEEDKLMVISMIDRLKTAPKQ